MTGLGKINRKKRRSLMPFVWNEIVKIGQIFGNRNLEAKLI